MTIRALSAAVLTAALTVVAQAGHAADAQYKVGDRVAMPAGYQDKYLDAVVIAVDPSNPYPYRVHPLGYLNTMDTSFNAKQLKAQGTIQTQPIGGIVNDPYLLAAKGQKAFHPTALYPGAYECYTYTGGRLVSAGILNFTVLDARRYRDISGAVGAFNFDPASGAVVFRGGSLNGQRAKYEQASNPPVKTQPPAVTLDKSGDSCELTMR